MKRLNKEAQEIDLRMSCEAARRIRQHGHSPPPKPKFAVCIGRLWKKKASPPSRPAYPAPMRRRRWHARHFHPGHVGAYLLKSRNRDYPQARIVGWYHSHPGFGVFLSDHDTFIHKNFFFSSPRQVAWVYDPHSDEEGCFGWTGDKLRRLSHITFFDDKGGESAGETGKPEPILNSSDEGAKRIGPMDTAHHRSL